MKIATLLLGSMFTFLLGISMTYAGEYEETIELFKHAGESAVFFNNCYAYANNQITNTFPQPGRGTGRMYTVFGCTGAGAVEPAAVSDGLAPCPNFGVPLAPGRGWYVALVIWPGKDYHWYRQDKAGCWSHKPGNTPVRNVDNSGRAISDPRTADRGNYTVFCSYMIARAGLSIR